MSEKLKACKTCEWYAAFFPYGSVAGACMNKHSGKFTSGYDDSCKYWQERNAQADSELKKIPDTL